MTREEIFETLSNVYMTPQEHRAWKELYAKVTKYEDDKDVPYKEDMKYYEVENWANDNGYIVVTLKMFDKMMNAYKAMPKIREEIAEYKDDKIIHAERNEMIDIVLDIIDRYRAESEET